MTPTSVVSTRRRAESSLQASAGPLPSGGGAAIPFATRLGSRRGSTSSLFFKQVLDFFLAGMLLIFCSPLFLVVAAIIKLTSPGPVFYIQRRVGRRGTIFPFFKFRTMKHNSDDSVHRNFSRDFIRGTNGENGGTVPKPAGSNVYKLTRDPRVTSVGRFLRRTSLDELPQLINVLRGEMSLVGPRPPVLYELEHYQEWHKHRLDVKPGITGLWQVSGRSSVPFDEMVLLDLYYIEHRSLIMDLRIMLKTLPVMLTGDGAY